MNAMLDTSMLMVMAPVFLALVLAAAALPKFKKMDEFVGIVANYRLLPDALVTPFAKGLPVVEVVIALALLLPPLHAFAGMASAVLFIMFAVALAVNLGRGRTHIDCGCTRRPTSRSRIGLIHVLRALALAGIGLYIAVTPLNLAALSLASTAIGIAAAGMLVMVYLSADLLIGLPKSVKDLPINHGRTT